MPTQRSAALQAWQDACKRDRFQVTVYPRPATSAGEIATFWVPWGEDWDIRGMISLVAGTLAISEVTVTLDRLAHGQGVRRMRKPGDGPFDGVTTTMLRSLPVGKILAQARLAILAKPDLVDELEKARIPIGPKEKELSAEAASRADAARPRRGRPSLGDDHYRRIALAYLKLQNDGAQRGLLDKLAEQEGRPRETIRDWVHQARVRQFLSPGRPGRAGAEPGPRLRVAGGTKRGSKA